MGGWGGGSTSLNSGSERGGTNISLHSTLKSVPPVPTPVLCEGHDEVMALCTL